MPRERSALHRILGLGFGLAVIVGSTLGIGILRTPGLVAAQLGSSSVILTVWIVGGLYTLLGAVCLTELGAMLPQAGGYYVYARRAFGDAAGFAVGWTDWLTYCAVLGYVSIGLGEFVGTLWPAAAPHHTAVGTAALLGFVALNWGGLHLSERFQQWTTAIKFALFLALVIGCLTGSPPPTGGGAAAIAPLTFASLIVGLQSVVITYGGWQSALYFTEEDRDPARNLPRAMIGGVAAVILVYLLVNLALLRALPIGALAASTLPAADAAARLLGTRGGQIITLVSVVSLIPMVNAIMMIGTRILFAMSRDGFLPAPGAAVNAGGTPTVATAVTTIAAAALIATGTFQRLVAVASFFLAMNYVVCCVALIQLRRREPGLPRPVRAWGYPASAVIVAAGSTIFLIGAIASDRVDAGIALALFLVGIAGYAMLPKRQPHAARL